MSACVCVHFDVGVWVSQLFNFFLDFRFLLLVIFAQKCISCSAIQWLYFEERWNQILWTFRSNFSAYLQNNADMKIWSRAQFPQMQNTLSTNEIIKWKHGCSVLQLNNVKTRKNGKENNARGILHYDGITNEANDKQLQEIRVNFVNFFEARFYYYNSRIFITDHELFMDLQNVYKQIMNIVWYGEPEHFVCATQFFNFVWWSFELEKKCCAEWKILVGCGILLSVEKWNRELHLIWFTRHFSLSCCYCFALEIVLVLSFRRRDYCKQVRMERKWKFKSFKRWN